MLLLMSVGLLAAGLGLTIHLSQRQRAAQQQSRKLRLPQQWPLNPRPLVNSAERRVWRWLGWPPHRAPICYWQTSLPRIWTPKPPSRSSNPWWPWPRGAP